MRFKIGNRIRICKDLGFSIYMIYSGRPFNAHEYDNFGLTGTIVDIRENRIAVELDENIGGHTCGGKTKLGHGWWVFDYQYDDIELILGEEEATIDVSDFL